MTTSDARKRLAEGAGTPTRATETAPGAPQGAEVGNHTGVTMEGAQNGPDALEAVERLQAERDRYRTYAYGLARIVGMAETIEGHGEVLHSFAGFQDTWDEVTSAANDHHDCPILCELCGEMLATETCSRCHGSGCLPNAALAYLECGDCAGAGRVHVGCVEKSYADLVAENAALRAQVDAVKALVGHPYGVTPLWVAATNGVRYVPEPAIRAALAATSEEG